MRDINFVTGEYYHIYNRGVDKRPIFLHDYNFQRFLESLHLFNDSLYAAPTNSMQRIEALSMSEVFDFERDHFVDVCSYTLIPNHYHLLVCQLKDGGISKLMHKLDMGYTKYLNHQLERSGTLYEGEFKAIHVKEASHLIHLPVYIHLNILDLYGFPWREGVITDWEEALRLMASYRWSSHGAFLGKDQRLPIVKSETIKSFYVDNEDYLGHLRGWSERSLSEHLAQLG